MLGMSPRSCHPVRAGHRAVTSRTKPATRTNRPAQAVFCISISVCRPMIPIPRQVRRWPVAIIKSLGRSARDEGLFQGWAWETPPGRIPQ